MKEPYFDDFANLRMSRKWSIENKMYAHYTTTKITSRLEKCLPQYFYPLNNSFCPQDSIPPLKNFVPWQMNAFLIRGNTHILCLELPLHNPIADQENKTCAPSSEVIAQEIICKLKHGQI